MLQLIGDEALPQESSSAGSGQQAGCAAGVGQLPGGAELAGPAPRLCGPGSLCSWCGRRLVAVAARHPHLAGSS